MRETDMPADGSNIGGCCELWNALGSPHSQGVTVALLGSLCLDGFASKSSIRKQLRRWADAGLVASDSDGRAQRWCRLDEFGSFPSGLA